jgi:hypothetical protein
MPNDSDDIRSRIAELLGPRPSEDAVRKGQELLADAFRRRGETRRAALDEQEARNRIILAPLMNLIRADKAAAAAAERLPQKAPGQRSKKPARRGRGRLQPQIRTSPMSVTLTAPYDFEWTSTGQQGQTPNGWAATDKNRGTFVLTADQVNGQTGSRSVGAGLGVFFRPMWFQVPVQVTASLWPLWSYVDSSSWGITAHSSGSIEMYVISADPDGRNQAVEVAQSQQLWSDGTGWFDHHSDSGGSSQQFPISFTGTSARMYNIYLLGYCAADDRSGSQASGELEVILDQLTITQTS